MPKSSTPTGRVAVVLVGAVRALHLPIALQQPRYAVQVPALELVWPARVGAVGLVRLVRAVRVAIALPRRVDAVHPVGALELADLARAGSSRRGTVALVRAVQAVYVPVAVPPVWDTAAVAAHELRAGAGDVGCE